MLRKQSTEIGHSYVFVNGAVVCSNLNIRNAVQLMPLTGNVWNVRYSLNGLNIVCLLEGK
jgi:hypothetical protein